MYSMYNTICNEQANLPLNSSDKIFCGMRLSCDENKRIFEIADVQNNEPISSKVLCKNCSKILSRNNNTVKIGA